MTDTDSLWYLFDSSLVVRARYSEKDQILDLELSENRYYRYYDVPQFTFERFRRAESPGRFFNDEIRDSFEWESL